MRQAGDIRALGRRENREDVACAIPRVHWLNQYEIEDAMRLASSAHDRDVPGRANLLYAACSVLEEYMSIVNRNSDGWPHWSAGSRVAEDLCDIVSHQRAFTWMRHSDTCTCVSEAAIIRAVRRITNFCKRRNLPLPAPPAFAKATSTGTRRNTGDDRALSLFSFVA